MPDPLEVRTPSELMQNLEQSGILRPEELSAARRVMRETPTSRMMARRLVVKGLLTRWQAGQLLVGWTRLRLGNYRLCRQVGRGAYGRVFLAEHISMHRDVAIKTLSRRFTQQSDIVDRFLNDAREAAALDHRNLVHVLDVDAADDQYYMVMEYVVGLNLQRLVERDGPCSPLQAAEYLFQAAGGLECVHQAGMVHQDICPSNLMLDEKGDIKILGLGMGHLAGPKESVSIDEDGLSERTGDYRAPEQRGASPACAARSDIYALGLTGAYLLTGKSPSGAGDDSDAAVLAADESAINWALMRPDVPKSLAAILDEMTDADPEQRPGGADQVRARLKTWLDENQQQAAVALPSVSPRIDVSRPSHPGDGMADLDTESNEDSQTDEAAVSDKWNAKRIATFVAAIFIVLGVALATYGLWPEPSDRLAQGDPPQKSVSESRRPSIRERPKIANGRRVRKAADESTMPAVGAGVAGSEAGRSPPAGDEATSDVARSDPETTDRPPSRNTVPQTEAAKKEQPDPAGAAKQKSKAEVEDAKKAVSQKQVVPFADNPLRGLPTEVDLPPLGDDEAAQPTLDVAAIPAPVARQLRIRLLGGEFAAGRSTQFALRAATEPHAASWTVLLENRDEDEAEGVAIARVSVEDSRLRFAWESAASAREQATCLRNCVLRLGVQRHVHDVRLRTAVEVEPLVVDLKRPKVDERWNLDAAPDPRQVRFEVTQLEDPFPNNYNLDPVEPIPADDEKVLVKVGAKGLNEHVLLLELHSQYRVSLRLECNVYFLVAPQAKPIQMNQKNFEGMLTSVYRSMEVDNYNAQQARAAVNSLQRNNPRRQKLEKGLKTLEARLARTRRAVNRMDALGDLRKDMADGAALHFRLYYLADGVQVDLLRSVSH